MKTGGVGSTLVSALKHPITLGSLGGGAVGGGLGYLAPDDPSLRNRGALVGAGTGALMGGLGGALASGGMQPDEAAKMRDVVFGAGQAAGHRAGVRKGFDAGRESIINNLPTDVPMTQAIKDMLLSKLRGGA